MEDIKEANRLVDIIKKDCPKTSELEFLCNGEDLVIEDARAGLCFLNSIYRISSKDGQSSIIMKYGDDSVKGLEAADFGENPHERRELEYECLKMFHSILPGSVPQPYYFNKQINLILMEDMGKMSILGSQLREGNFNIDDAAKVGTLFATIQMKTHRRLVSHETWKEYQGKLKNEASVNFLYNLRFDWMLKEGRVPIYEGLKDRYTKWMTEIEEDGLLKDIRKLYHREDCLIHVDCHWDAVFVSNERIAVFDLEFGGLGNQAYSIASLMACYIMGVLMAGDKYPDKIAEFNTQAKLCCQAMYSSFISTLGDKLYLLEPLSSFVSEMAAVIGQQCFNISHCIIIEFQPEGRAKLADLGIKLIKAYKEINTITALIECMFL